MAKVIPTEEDVLRYAVANILIKIYGKERVAALDVHKIQVDGTVAANIDDEWLTIGLNKVKLQEEMDRLRKEEWTE